MKLTKSEIKNQYKIIFNNQNIQFPKTSECIQDNITFWNYVPSHKDDRKLIKHLRTMMELIDLYRKDFPSDWRQYLYYDFREDTKNKARDLLKQKNMLGFELLIKAWWGREIHINFKNPHDIYKLVSFDDYMRNVILNFLYLKNKKVSWNNINHIKSMTGYKKIEEHEWDLYFKNLIKKYNVNINDPKFRPKDDFLSLMYVYNDMSWYR